MTFSLLPFLLASPLLFSPAPALQAPAPPKATVGAKPAPAVPKPAAKAGAAKTGAARTIELSGGDDMKFTLTDLQAKRGEQIRLVFKNIGTMPKIAMAHNVVVLKDTADPVAFSNAAMMARATDFIPPDMKAQVLAHTGLAGPGETVEVVFTVPAKAGSYPYVCTFPGHFAAGMKGKLVVK